MHGAVHSDENRPDCRRPAEVMQQLVRDVAGAQVREDQNVRALLENTELVRRRKKLFVEGGVGLHLSFDDDRGITFPKKPDSEWAIDPEEAAALTDRLGNLALVKKADNGRLRSAPFDVKRAVLRNQGFALTTIIADNEQWGAEQVEGRQRRLARLALDAWPIRPKTKRTRSRRGNAPEDVFQIAHRTTRESTGT